MKNFPGLVFVFAIALMFGGALYFYGGARFTAPSFSALFVQKSTGQNSPVPFTELEKGVSAPSVNTRVNYVITNADELGSLWELVYGNNGPTIPTVDFEKYTVLAVFDGSHTTNGFAIEVNSIKDIGGKRMVMITRTTPGANCPTVTLASSPFQIIRIQKTSITLDHVDTTVSKTSCAQ